MSATKVAILYICTGDYVYFWERFYRSFGEKFLPEAEKDYFVFTDAKELFAEKEDPHIHRIHQEDLGWPGNTLYRFRMICSIEEELKPFDYLFLFNANLVCLETIHAADVLPDGNRVVVVQHPTSDVRRPYKHPYDRNRASLAYIPYGELKAKYYVCGGINGGSRDAYLKMMHELDRRIRQDDANGVLARYHDESHINRYIVDYPDYRLLSAEYAYPEGWDLPHGKKFLLLDKSKYIRLDESRIQVYERPVWYVRYAGYLKTYAERALTALRSALLEVWFRAHGC